MDSPIAPISSTPPQPAVQPTVSSLPESPNRQWFLWLAGGLAIFTLGVALGVFGVKFLNQSQNLSQLPSIPTPTQSPTPTLVSDPTADWKTYTNNNLGFSIRYPAEWRVVESGGAISSVGFGPKEIPEDFLWEISVYNTSQTSEERIINEARNQFSDRKQTTEFIILNGVSATKLITTTPSHADWYSVTIIVESNTKIYAISNGAINDAKFEDFYYTFKFTAFTPPISITDWKTYANSTYGFSFKHPGLNKKCCGMAGAVSGNPIEIITLADITTTAYGTDKPFDGLAVYIIPNENNLSLDQYIETEKTALSEQAKVMAGDPNWSRRSQAVKTEIMGQQAISLVDYSWDGIVRTYFKHPSNKVIVEISKSEESPGHFSYYDQILSTFYFLK